MTKHKHAAGLTQGLILLVAAMALTGCESIGEAMGTQKVVPDEFTVVEKPALVVPPEFNLRPPLTGETSATTQQAAQRPLSPATVEAASAALGSGYSQGELQVLYRSGALDTDPQIRKVVTSESGYTDPGKSSTDAIINSPATGK
jgi:hypothetical protein